MNSLDMEIGGETAVNLHRLYSYLYYRLVQANIKKDVVMIDEVLNHLKDLKATWEEAIRITNREKASVNILNDQGEEDNENKGLVQRA